MANPMGDPTGTPVYFITGAFGFLGQYIVQALHEHDPQAELRLLVHTRRKTLLPIESLDGVKLVEGDMTRVEAFESELEGAETVIHNAALVSFRPSDAERIHQANTLGTIRLLQAALERGCRSFIFISSISAIGADPNGGLANESMFPSEDKLERDAYGRSKLAGERALQAQAARLRGVILNPSVIIGPGSRRIEMAQRWLPYIPAFPMLTSMTSLVDVRDVARAVVLSLTAGRSGERYIVTSKNIDLLSFTRAILKTTGRSAPVFPAPDWLIRLADGAVAGLDRLKLNPGIRPISGLSEDKAYSSEKIRRELGWQPVYSLEQSLADMLAPQAKRSS